MPSPTEFLRQTVPEILSYVFADYVDFALLGVGVICVFLRGQLQAFFEARLEALTRAGVDPSRCVLDPGMGFFLGNKPETSWVVLRHINRLKKAFDLPVLLSVSRKSFLRALVDCPPDAAGPASLSAELFAARQQVDYIRTHDVGQLDQALKVARHLNSFL